MAEKVLVVGGTGPTGRHIVNGLAARGHEVTIFHRGNHEVPDQAALEHIHGDPHFSDTIAAALGDRTFDTVLGMYGRTALVAKHFAERQACQRFIGIGSDLGYDGWVSPASSFPTGAPVPCREDAPQVGEEAAAQSPGLKFARKIVTTEQSVLSHHDPGNFDVTWMRYSVIYGPGNVIPWEWSVLKRIRDGREFIAIFSDGMEIRSRLYAENAAHSVLLAFDKPEQSAGEIFNCADDQQYTQRQWIDVVAKACGGQLELISMPWEIAEPAWCLLPSHIESVGTHGFADTHKIRSQLGYHDVVTAPEAIRRTVEFYESHPVTADEFPNLQDRFDYDNEDRLVADYKKLIGELQVRLNAAPREAIHPYPHPREVNGVRVDARGR